MKKTVIANWGIGKQGKTITIKFLLQIILQNDPTSVLNTPASSTYDIRVIITLSNGIKVGIETAGDPGSPLENSLKEFVTNNCDLIICCTRTDGATVQAVEALYTNQGYDIIWVNNFRSKEVDINKLNRLSADNIYDLMIKRMSGIL
jgi:hypothetical protein